MRGGRQRRRWSVTARTDAGELLLRVADTGPGVPEDADVFRRGWSTKADDGHGLGLALVGQAVRRYGGTVESAGTAARCSPCGCRAQEADR